MLTIIQVGEDQASSLYVRNKIKAVEKAGLKAEHIALPAHFTTEEIIWRIKMLSKWSTAIIVQLPLPEHIDKAAVLAAIPPEKDIDGLAPNSPYKPLTPCAIMRWLNEKGVDLKGKNVTVLGRSELVGKPLANMLIDAGATVTVCNSHTMSSMKHQACVFAEIVISAVGRRGIVSLSDVSRFRKQIFIDVGINRDENGKLCGDLSNGAKERLDENGSEYTPVPGGVGKWTVRELVIRLKEMEEKRNG